MMRAVYTSTGRSGIILYTIACNIRAGVLRSSHPCVDVCVCVCMRYMRMGLESVRIHKHYLILLSTCGVRQRKVLIETISKIQYEALCELILNILNGASILNQDTIDKLQRSRGIVRDWADRRIKKSVKLASFLRHQKLIPLLLTDIEKLLTE
jgi:hypothetical protein